MDGIRNMLGYWNSLHKEDRKSLMEDHYFTPELGNLEFKDLPTHIRGCLYRLWQNKFSKQDYEFEP